MNILIGCEYSGITRDAFLKHTNHNVLSCDFLPSESNLGLHYQGDIRDIIYSGKWDLLIAFPPCTYLCNVGSSRHHKNTKEKQNAIDFFMELYNAPIEKICIENPVGCISNIYKPTQIIQPYQFGHKTSKRTCLWLKNLPDLKPTRIVKPKDSYINRFPTDINGHLRSKGFIGIANAMAKQWSDLI